MPFLDRLQGWAEVQPRSTAVEVGTHRLGFAELRDRAAELVPKTPALSVLSLPNGVDFAVRFAAGIAGERRCAVLDAGWPTAARQAVEARLVHAPRPAGRLGTELRDGPADSVFLYGFTSGTTAVPRAFTRIRRSWPLEHSAEHFALTRQDRTLAPGPLSSGLTLYALAESLSAGAAFFSLPRFDVGAALACVAERRITRLVAVPQALRLIAARGRSAGVDGSSVTSVVSAGAKLDPATRDFVRSWAPNATIFEYYGAAELSFVSVSVQPPSVQRPSYERPSGRPAGETSGSATLVGRPYPGVTIRIQDDAGRELPAGRPGTIAVRSPLVSEGYAWGDDGLGFRREGDWCTVGDEGFLDAGGALHHLGRRADMIVTGGHNVYPHEVESALEGVAGVDAAVVTGLPDAARGSRLVAAVLAEPGVSAAVLREACAALLAGPQRPRAYLRLTQLPLTAAGKLSRRLLRDWIEGGDARVHPLD